MGLDQTALNQLRELDPDGSSGFLAQIIDAYLTDAAKLIQGIQATFAAKDVVTMKRNAHSLIATSASVGAMRVSNVARELETACKNEAFDVVPLFLTVLVAEYAAAERLLKTERSARLSPPVMAQSGRYARVNDRSGDRVSASSF